MDTFLSLLPLIVLLVPEDVTTSPQLFLNQFSLIGLPAHDLPAGRGGFHRKSPRVLALIPVESSPRRALVGLSEPGFGDPGASLGEQLFMAGATSRILKPCFTIGQGFLLATLGGSALVHTGSLLLLALGDRREVDRRNGSSQLSGEESDGVALTVDSDTAMAVVSVVRIDVAENVGHGPALVVDVMLCEDSAKVSDVLPAQPWHSVDQSCRESLDRQARAGVSFVAAPFPCRARQRGAW